jgi:hypothetical protein
MTSINLLPNEVIRLILDFLYDEDKVSLLTVSKSFRRLVLDNTEFSNTVDYFSVKEVSYYDNFTSVSYPVFQNDIKFPKKLKELLVWSDKKILEIIPNDICKRIKKIFIDRVAESIKLDKFTNLKVLLLSINSLKNLQDDFIIPEGVEVFIISSWYKYSEKDMSKIRFILPDSIKRVEFISIDNVNIEKNDYNTVESIKLYDIESNKCQVMNFIKNCTNLKSVSIYDPNAILIQDLSNTLTELNLIYTNTTNGITLDSLNLERFESLKTLKILKHTYCSLRIKNLTLPPHLEALYIHGMIDELHLPSSLKRLYISGYVEKHLLLPEGIECLETSWNSVLRIINYELRNLRKLSIGVCNPFICKPFFSKNLKEAYFLNQQFKIRPSLKLEKITTLAISKKKVKRLRAYEKVILCLCNDSMKYFENMYNNKIKRKHKVIIKGYSPSDDWDKSLKLF